MECLDENVSITPNYEQIRGHKKNKQPISTEKNKSKSEVMNNFSGTVVQTSLDFHETLNKKIYKPLLVHFDLRGFFLDRKKNQEKILTTLRVGQTFLDA